MAGWQLPFIYCLLFGALISPTDPIAVLGILKLVGASKKLESRITGESLFNDGTGVVLFMVLLGLATGSAEASPSSIAGMFALEAGGGILFGMAAGAGALWMLRQIDSYAVEIMLTLALVTAGYSLAEWMHLSAPLYVVAAGLVIGNLGPGKALSKHTQAHLFPFWQLVDEILNLLLFGLIGLELLALDYRGGYVIAGLVMVAVVLFCRWLSVALPMRGLQRFLPERDERHGDGDDLGRPARRHLDCVGAVAAGRAGEGVDRLGDLHRGAVQHPGAGHHARTPHEKARHGRGRNGHRCRALSRRSA